MEAQRPRLFWRRLFATLFDVFLCMQISFVLTAPFVGNGDQFRFTGQFALLSTFCVPTATIPPEVEAFLGDAQQKSVGLCYQKVNGLENGQKIVAVARDVQSNGVSTQRKIEFAVNSQGQLVAPLALQDVLYTVLIVIGGGALLRRGKQTPGKRLLGLRVVGAAHPFRREALKYVLTIASSVMAVAAFLMGPEQIMNLLFASFDALWMMVAFGILAAVAVILYWIVPFFRWRGQMPWDKWSGSYVERATP